MLLLMRNPDRAWTAPEVTSSLGMAPEPTAMRLFLLASSGLIAFEPAAIPRYRYAAGDGETHALLTELSQLYDTNRDVVASLVDAPADPIRTFADAFRLKP